jgi:hypothetical protein
LATTGKEKEWKQLKMTTMNKLGKGKGRKERERQIMNRKVKPGIKQIVNTELKEGERQKRNEDKECRKMNRREETKKRMDRYEERGCINESDSIEKDNRR